MLVAQLVPGHLAEAHRLLSAGLWRDRFSADLIREKLFHCLSPSGTPDEALARDEQRVLGAFAQGGELLGLLQYVVRRAARRGYLGLFATAQFAQRRGVATALLGEARAAWAAAGVAEVDVLGIPGNYFAPGLDPVYTGALCFLERRGFVRHGDCVNLRCDLRTADEFDTGAEEQALAGRGMVIRRAEAADGALLDAFFGQNFGAAWRLEAERALGGQPAGLHLALREGRVVAFSAHSAMNREWGFFGPMGTAKEAEGLGLGRVLLRRCLRDLREAGHPSAVIPWVGPIGFYARHAPCQVERVYWRYRLKLGG